MQTKKIRCKQKRLDANKKDRMQTKNQKTCHDAMQTKRSDASKKDRMQTKTKPCHDANANKKPKPVTMQALA